MLLAMPKVSASLRVILLVAVLVPAALHAASPEEQAVLAPVQAMFDGMAHRDAAAIRAPLLPGGSLVLMRDGKPVRMSFDDFAARVARPGTTNIEERIHDPVVRIDNDLAVVWAPFDSSATEKSTTAARICLTWFARTASG
jgi:hypothetical protein